MFKEYPKVSNSYIFYMYLKKMYPVSYTHLNDAVRKACPVKKVNSSRSKNQTVILSETELDTETVMNAIRSTGYEDVYKRQAPARPRRPR